MSDALAFTNPTNEDGAEPEVVNLFNNNPDFRLGTDDNPFANTTYEDEPDLEIVCSSSSRYLPSIAPKPPGGQQWPAGWIPPVDHLAIPFPSTNQFG
jgi:hypothetical protein